ncbi:hypothetical protein D3C75_1265620 [compost metagenome]
MLDQVAQHLFSQLVALIARLFGYDMIEIVFPIFIMNDELEVGSILVAEYEQPLPHLVELLDSIR